MIVLPPLDHFPKEAEKPLEKLASEGRLIRYNNNAHPVSGSVTIKDDKQYIELLRKTVSPDLVLDPPASGIRYRHIVKKGVHFYMIFNEVNSPVQCRVNTSVKGVREWWNPLTTERVTSIENEIVSFDPFEMKILCVLP
jgi:hypothetical protein